MPFPSAPLSAAHHPQHSCAHAHHPQDLMGSSRASSPQSPSLQPWVCRAEKGQILSPATASVCSDGFSEAPKRPLSGLSENPLGKCSMPGNHLGSPGSPAHAGCELPWKKRKICCGVAELCLGIAPPAWLFGVWVISASHWRVAQGVEAASRLCSLRGQEAPVREPWLSPDHLPCLPPSSGDPDLHGRNTFTA